MGRSGYSDCDDYDTEDQYLINLHAGALASALRGRRGQAFLQRLAAALDSMPAKSLCKIQSGDEVDGVRDPVTRVWTYPPGTDRLGLPDGQVCVLGSLAKAEGMDPVAIDATEHKTLAKLFNVSEILVRELEWENDQRYSVGPDGETEGEARWRHLREWVVAHTVKPVATEPA